MSLIENIIAKCKEVQKAAEFNKTLAGKARDPEWVEVDPGYTMLKDMSKVAADKVVSLAQELRALIP